MTLQKYFSHPSLVIYFFAIPPRKYCRYVGTTNSKPPGLITMFGQSKTGDIHQIIFIALFSIACAQLSWAFYRPHETEHMCRRQTIFPSQTRICWLLFIRFLNAGPALVGMLEAVARCIHAWSSHYTIHGHIDEERDIVPRFCIEGKACSPALPPNLMAIAWGCRLWNAGCLG